MTDAIDELIEYRRPYWVSPMLRRVRRFHKANPQVLDFLIQELREVRESGWLKISLGSLWHHARWVLTQKYRTPGETFAMSNNLFPCYERIIIILHPEFNGFYEMAKSQADADLGTMLEPVSTPGKVRRLLWADGTPIEHGWRPNTPHEPKPVSRRERVRRKPSVSVGLTAADFTAFIVTDRPAVCDSCGPASGTYSPVIIKDKQFCVWCALGIAEALLSPNGQGRFERALAKIKKARA
jgi:hypothetical protein